MFGLTLGFLRPDFTWGFLSHKSGPLPTSVPPTPRPAPRLIRLLWGYVHKLLIQFSYRYQGWYGIPINGRIHYLPFGLLIKWSDGTRVEECQATQIARAARFPVPIIVCYGEHTNSDHAPVSILMTRMPGKMLSKDIWEAFRPEEKATFISEMKSYIDTMRHWKSPWNGKDYICSVAGTSIRSLRVPNQSIGPCKSEEEFNNLLMQPTQDTYVQSFPHYERDLMRSKELLFSKAHKMVFTHGDISQYNILVMPDGHVSAILDWELAGWYPEYWEYSMAWRFAPRGDWWFEIVTKLSEGRFLEELDGHLAVYNLTSMSFL